MDRADDIERKNELVAGTLVGSYRIERRIGGGGTGVVYAALEAQIGKRVAIKVLKRSFTDDPEFVTRFRREAGAANAVRHPAIVDAFAFGHLPDGRPYFVMSLLEGRSLREELALKGSLSPEGAWRIAREIADALSAVHEVGVIHRDLKPDNVFLETVGKRAPRLRVLDFGIAKSAAADAEAGVAITEAGVRLGTPAYMAPEQWWNAEVDARADQYSLGVMLFEMLGGRPPFDPEHPAGIVRQHLHEPPPSLREHGCQIGEQGEQFVARLLAKDRAERFASMRELILAGDAAFGGPLATDDARADDRALAPTEIADGQTGSRDSLAAGARVTRPFVRLHAAVVALGSASLFALGYAGPERRDFPGWMLIGGAQSYAVVGVFLLAAILLVPLALRSAERKKSSAVVWLFALSPAAIGSLGTYVNWEAVRHKLDRFPATQAFDLFNAGVYEAGITRFMGMAGSAFLCLSLVALVSFRGRMLEDAELSRASDRARRAASIGKAPADRVSGVAAAVLGVLAGMALLGGAPSGAYVAMLAAAALLLAARFSRPSDPGRAEAERAVAMICSVALIGGAALTRLDAREAILWFSEPTRRSRVEEILSASAERTATLPILFTALLGVCVIGALRVRSTAALLQARKREAVALVVLLVLAAGVDTLLARRFLAQRESLRAELAPQFAMFSRLDPPADERLDPERHAPHRAPALQITRDVVAVNGERIAKLAALEAAPGIEAVRTALLRALAHPEESGAGPDLSCSIDREVRWDLARKLLTLAYEAGARRIELLLTRGAAPALPVTGPPEIGLLLPKDFVAVPAQLGPFPTTVHAESRRAASRFGEIAPDLVTALLANDKQGIAIDVSEPEPPTR